MPCGRGSLPVEQAVERAGGIEVPERFAVHGGGQVVVDDGDGAGRYLARGGKPRTTRHRGWVTRPFRHKSHIPRFLSARS